MIRAHNLHFQLLAFFFFCVCVRVNHVRVVYKRKKKKPLGALMTGAMIVSLVSFNLPEEANEILCEQKRERKNGSVQPNKFFREKPYYSNDKGNDRS